MSNVDFDALATQVSLERPLPDEGFRSLQQAARAPRYGGKIGSLQAAGFSDEEITQWATTKREELVGAGFNDDEINTYFTGALPAPAKIPQPFIDRLLDGERWSAVLKRAGKGFVEGWNPDDPIGIDPGGDVDRFMTDTGLAGAGPLRMLNEALLRPSASAIDVLARSFIAGVHGTAGAVAGLYEEIGGESIPEIFGGGESGQAKRLERDLIAGANLAALLYAGKTPVTRVKRLGGQTTDQNIGGLPASQDFADSAKTFTGRGQPEIVQQKLLTLYKEHGVHPSEVVDDALNDPDVAAAILSDDIADLPTRYKAPPKEGDILGNEVGQPKAAAGGGGGPKGPDIEGVAASSIPDAETSILKHIDTGEHRLGEPYSWNKFYTDTIDRLWPLPDDPALAAIDSPYKSFRMLAGSPSKARHMLKYGMIDFDTLEPSGRAFEQIIAPFKKDLNGLRAFLASIRALELNNRGVKTAFNVDDAYKVAQAGRDKYGPVALELYAYQNRLVDYLQKSGMLTPEGARLMKDMNKVYVPFYETIDPSYLTLGRALKARTPVKPKELGGIIDPLESIIRDTYMFTILADRNAAGVKLFDFLDRLDEVVPQGQPRSTQVVVPTRAVGEPKVDGFAGQTETIREVLETVAKPVNEKEISVFRNGMKETRSVDPDIARAFRGLDIGAIGFIERMIAPFARTLRAGAVMSPEFWFRHVFRDYFYGLVTGDKIFHPGDMVKGLVGNILKDEDYLKWQRYGGGHTTLTTLDRQYMQEDLDNLIGAGLLTRNWNVIIDPDSTMFERLKSLGAIPVQGADKLFISPLRAVTDMVQSSTQLGAFKKAMRELEKDEEPFTKKERFGAAWTARDTAVDMSRMGARMRAMNMVSTFLNATIQDPAKIGEQFTKKFAKTFLLVSAGITAPSLLLWAANKDDSRYRALPQWDKDMNWIFLTDRWETVPEVETLGRPTDLVRRMPNGEWQVNNGPIFRIPKPFTLGVLFGSGAERLAEEFFTDNPEAFKGFAQSLWDATIPNFVPTVADPIIEQYANNNLLSGQRIIPGYLENQLPEYQYTPYTTELTKALGQFIGAFPGISEAKLNEQALTGGVARALSTPILIENYIASWTGTLGTNLLKLSDYSLRKAGVLPDPTKPTAKLSDIPIIRAFVVRYPAATADQIQSFYNRQERLDKFYQTWKGRVEDGDIEAANRIMEFGGPVMFARLTNIRQVLSDHSKLIRNIYENPEVPAFEKRQLIDQLYFAMIQLAEEGNSVLAGVPDDYSD